MFEQVKDYCKSCKACVVTKSLNSKTGGKMTSPPIIIKPLKRMHANTLQVAITTSSYKHILVVINSFNKYIHIIPLTVLTRQQQSHQKNR